MSFLFAKFRAWKATVPKGPGLERRAIQTIVLLFFYSLVTAYIGRDSQPSLLQQNNDSHEYDGLLMRTLRGYDFFDFTPLNFDQMTFDVTDQYTKVKKEDFIFVPIPLNELRDEKRQALTDGENLRFEVLGAHTLIATDSSYARIYDTDDRKTYDLLRKENMEVASFTNRKDLLYTTGSNGFSLHYLFANCVEPETFSLAGTDVPAAGILKESNFPIQKQIILSPAQTYAVILDHDFQSRIRIISLISHEITEIFVPGFAQEQIHFSPSFVGEDNVAFSIYDGEQEATILYSMKDRTSSTLSADFSDAIYVSRSGQITLAQSFYRLSGNVPFGSLKLLQGRAMIPRTDIESIFREDKALWRRIFKNPNDDRLSFHDDARMRFKLIDDPEKRRDIMLYWSELYDPFVPKQIDQHIIVLENLVPMHVFSMNYTVNAETPYLRWNHDISPLLETLGFPTSVIQEYRYKRAQNGGEYYLQNLR